jgi:hypothetical protein
MVGVIVGFLDLYRSMPHADPAVGQDIEQKLLRPVAARLMSATPPIAAQKRTSLEFRVVPISNPVAYMRFRAAASPAANPIADCSRVDEEVRY